MNPDIKDSLLKLRIVWGALCLPIFVHGFLLVGILDLHIESGEPLAGLMGSLTRYPGIVFFGLSVFLLVMSRLIPGVLFRENMKKRKKGDPQEVLSFYWVSYLIGMVMLEGIGFLGLLLTILENDLRIYILFAMVALLNMLIRYPRQEALLGLFEAGRAAEQTIVSSQS